MGAEKKPASAAFMAAALFCIAAGECTAGTATTPIWSGYAFHAPSGTTVNSVQGTWTVPAVNGSVTPNAYASFWVGMDGYYGSPNTVEQIGTGAYTAANGAPAYYAWYEMYPDGAVGIPMAILPGDTVSASVQYLASSGLYQLSMTDLSHPNESYTNDFPYPGPPPSRSTAEWIAEAPSSGGVLPLTEFGVVNFTGASASLSNGVSGPISAFPYDSVIMSATSSGLGAAPSPLDPTGTSFSVATTWPGDVDSDGKVDINDLTIVLAHYGQTTGMWWGTGDLNGDGRVDINDLTIVLAYYGETLGASAGGAAAVPEPASLLLAAAGAAGLLACAWPKRAV
jgi:hypothetical protein